MPDTITDTPPFRAVADDLLTRDEFARLVGISPRTAVHWEHQGVGPRPSRVSPRIALYSRREAVAFLRDRRAA